MKDIRLWQQFLIIVALGVGLNQSICQAKDNETSVGKDGKAATPSTRGGGNAYLGLIIEDLHPAMASHVPGIGSNGQGVLVQQVSPDSPAGKAGIKEHDILLTYGDQKLFNHEQLLRLVSGDQPGTEVEIRLIREGKQETLKLRLEGRPANWIAPGFLEERPPRPPRFGWRRGQPRFGPAVNMRASWNHIDSISIKRLEKNRFHAALTHVNNEGKLEKHEYEGTREELRKLIDADDNLKANERYHLLRSLDIGDHPNPWLLFPDDDSSSF
jgi:hypothetical protein